MARVAGSGAARRAAGSRQPACGSPEGGATLPELAGGRGERKHELSRESPRKCFRATQRWREWAAPVQDQSELSASDEEVLAEDLDVDLAGANREVVGVLIEEDANGGQAPDLPPERVVDAAAALVLPLVDHLVRRRGLLPSERNTRRAHGARRRERRRKAGRRQAGREARPGTDPTRGGEGDHPEEQPRHA